MTLPLFWGRSDPQSFRALVRSETHGWTSSAAASCCPFVWEEEKQQKKEESCLGHSRTIELRWQNLTGMYCAWNKLEEKKKRVEEMWDSVDKVGMVEAAVQQVCWYHVQAAAFLHRHIVSSFISFKPLCLSAWIGPFSSPSSTALLFTTGLLLISQFILARRKWRKWLYKCCVILLRGFMAAKLPLITYWWPTKDIPQERTLSPGKLVYLCWPTICCICCMPLKKHVAPKLGCDFLTHPSSQLNHFHTDSNLNTCIYW